jgi:hypothetical protein
VSANVRFHLSSFFGSPIVKPPPWIEKSVGKSTFEELVGMKMLESGQCVVPLFHYI